MYTGSYSTPSSSSSSSWPSRAPSQPRRRRRVRAGREQEILPAWREQGLAPYDWSGRDERERLGDPSLLTPIPAPAPEAAVAVDMARLEIAFLSARVEALVAENQRLVDYLQERYERGL